MMRTIVLPAYNEAGYIAEMVSRSLKAGEMRTDPFEVIVVDNASKDDTAAIVQGLSRKDPRVRLLSHPENRLYAASCLTGAKAAKGERVFILDSDGQHPPADMWVFDEKMDEGFDIVFGWRVRRQERPARLLMSKVLWALAWWYIGYDLHDVNCGIRAFSRAYADKLEIRNMVNFVNPEFFVRAKTGGFKIGEAQVVQENRKAGVSSHEFGRLWRIFRTVCSYLRRLSQELKSQEVQISAGWKQEG